MNATLGNAVELIVAVRLHDHAANSLMEKRLTRSLIRSSPWSSANSMSCRLHVRPALLFRRMPPDFVPAVIGSILSNLLLVLGMCCKYSMEAPTRCTSLIATSVFAGGVKYSSQGFMIGAAQLNSSLLILSVIGILIPGSCLDNQRGKADPLTSLSATATFHAALTSNPVSNEGSVSTTQQGQLILKMSHGVAVILLFM